MLMMLQVKLERFNHNPETMYYKDFKERQAIPKQLLSAYMDVKANVENKRKKIQKNLTSGIFSFFLSR